MRFLECSKTTETESAMDDARGRTLGNGELVFNGSLHNNTNVLNATEFAKMLNFMQYIFYHH